MNSTLSLYSLHERIWHWLQAAGLICLILTGMAVHYPDRFGILGSMANAVRWHSWIGFALIVNAFLGIFYHLTAEKYQHFCRAWMTSPGRRFARRDSISMASLREKSTRSMPIPGANSTHCRRLPTSFC